MKFENLLKHTNRSSPKISMVEFIFYLIMEQINLDQTGSKCQNCKKWISTSNAVTPERNSPGDVIVLCPLPGLMGSCRKGLNPATCQDAFEPIEGASGGESGGSFVAAVSTTPIPTV